MALDVTRLFRQVGSGVQQASGRERGLSQEINILCFLDDWTRLPHYDFRNFFIGFGVSVMVRCSRRIALLLSCDILNRGPSQPFEKRPGGWWMSVAEEGDRENQYPEA